jgi:hypothetical protein
MPSFEPEEVAETIAQLLSDVDDELRELNDRIDALSREPEASEQTLSELRWLRRMRIARVSQLLERNDGSFAGQADGPGAV